METGAAGRGRSRTATRIHAATQVWFFILMLQLASVAYAQLPSQTVSSRGGQSSSGQVCSDPLLASMPECSALNQEEATPLPSSQMRSPMPDEYRGEPGSRSVNYSDIEQLSGQPNSRSQVQQAPLPPEPLTEFQRFVASTVNQVLPIYGTSLFNRVPSTFAPLDLAPVPQDFVVGPGDELRIRVWGQVNFQSNLRVDRSGEIFLPQIGLVHVEGMRFSELDQHLRSAIGRVYHNFDLTVDVGQIRAIQIYVSGEARRPGVYTVSSLSTLVDALFASGGPSIQGSMRHIQLRRGSAVVTEFDLYRLLIKGDKSTDATLQSGDVIFIPPAGPQVAVTGSVRNPAIYEMLSSESMADVIADSGGVSSVAAESRVSIERTGDHRDRHAMEVAFDANGLTTPLADGDLIRVYSIVPIYRETVILRGNTANSGRFAWRAGMRVSDLVPDKEALITRDYWWKRAQLGLPAPEFAATPDYDRLRQPAENNAITLRTPNQERTGLPEQEEPQQSQPGSQQNLYSFRPGQNLSAEQRAGSASLASAQATFDSRTKRSAHLTEAGTPAPEIDWDYAVIERLDPQTLKTILIPFDLGAVVLRHDASQDLTLNPGDVVSIFSEADIRVPIAHQTKTVILDGEFAHAGAYTVLPGETLRHLVERAGGLTPNAYLYGSEFTRESARAVQQARIDEYAQSLSLRMERRNLSMASSSMNSAQDLAGSTSAQSSERELLTNLRQIRATGRIVLEIKPDDNGSTSLPDVPLENGDRFAVPPIPSSVNVVGAVLDQNSFLYERSRKAGTYLQLAGGPSKDADRSREFIIRADGEVVSRDRERTLWGEGEFGSLRINPGDTIVVPEKTYKPSALRGVLDWSQMFSQLALGAAALSVIQ
jgi:protein involved in polysaccharide export with SLBB domain